MLVLVIASFLQEFNLPLLLFNCTEQLNLLFFHGLYHFAKPCVFSFERACSIIGLIQGELELIGVELQGHGQL